MRVSYIVHFEVSEAWLARKATQRGVAVGALRHSCREDIVNSLSDSLAYKDYAPSVRPDVRDAESVLGDMAAEIAAHQQWALSPDATAPEAGASHNVAGTIRRWLVLLGGVLTGSPPKT